MILITIQQYINVIKVQHLWAVIQSILSLHSINFYYYEIILILIPNLKSVLSLWNACLCLFMLVYCYVTYKRIIVKLLLWTLALGLIYSTNTNGIAFVLCIFSYIWVAIYSAKIWPHQQQGLGLTVLSC